MGFVFLLIHSQKHQILKQFLKFLFEIGPLVVFFIANGRWGIMPATAAFMVATAIALPAAWWLQRRLPIMPLVSGVFVLGFGGLTIALDDETFIKLKPTIVNLLFAAILAGGLVLRLGLLQKLFDTVFQLTERTPCSVEPSRPPGRWRQA